MDLDSLSNNMVIIPDIKLFIKRFINVYLLNIKGKKTTRQQFTTTIIFQNK